MHKYIMNKLTVTESFKQKLARLPQSSRVGDLHYLGADLPHYEGLPIVAIVGTRKPTPYGIAQTKKLAEELARAGVVIVSGLALGIDCIAHDAALRANGKTIAISPAGLNKIYPATNRLTGEKIIASGTIISEYSPELMPRKIEFLERNRIIAALSDVVIIPEAAVGSGSLNTANHAKKMDIPVCVLPGNVTSPMSAGTNQLLKEYAHAITDAQDVLKMLGLTKGHKQLSLDLIGDNPNETIILQKIALGHSTGDGLLNETLLDPVDFQTSSTMLEIQGRIMQDSTGNWSLK
jgi:DNA processing protein